MSPSRLELEWFAAACSGVKKTVAQAWALSPYGTCEECHKPVRVTADHSGLGFAGGHVVHIELSCGHNIHDESDDLRAAR